MSYRSFKRVLGETNLERKCLILFAACLLLLLTGAFWYAERNAEKLVEAKTMKTGQGWVSNTLLKHHMMTVFTDGESDASSGRDDWFETVVDIDRELSTEQYDWAILVPDDGAVVDSELGRTRTADSDREREIMADLDERLQRMLDELPPVDDEVEIRPVPDALVENGEPSVEVSPPSDANDGDSTTETLAQNTGNTNSIQPIAFLDKRGDHHYYYEVVPWRASCIICHTKENPSSFLPPQKGMRPEQRGPLRVVKVSLPASEAQMATTRSRAMLLATAIITVFLSVITLYLVVRYVIVKPLNHLRYVSDEISRGNTSLRADIQTNDEFEDLAAAYNRMLRHLIDSQEELRKVNSDLDGKLDQLAQANMQLHEMNRLKSDFLATMSHELRTPLNSIIGFSDVLKGIDALNDKQQRYVDNIGGSGRLLLEMINEILDLAKMESGKLEVRLTEFSIGPIIRAQSDLVRSLSEEKNIDLDVHLEPDLPLLYQDQGKVQQILTNLLSNAIKFTPEGGRIDVTASRHESGQLALIVKDTGVGIAEEDRKIIFEKFRQGSSAMGNDNLTRRFSGTGLGLSIVRELCRLLGGEIYFESEVGKGSTFTARIPMQRKEQPKFQASLSTRLDEVTKLQRKDTLRVADAQSADENANDASTADEAHNRNDESEPGVPESADASATEARDSTSRAS